nr:MAG TPA: hypothetical protein [Caudoviricetes sp.]
MNRTASTASFSLAFSNACTRLSCSSASIWWIAALVRLYSPCGLASWWMQLMHSKPLKYSPLAGVTGVVGCRWRGDGLESGAVQPEHNFTCVDQLINNEAIFTETKQIQSRNIAVVDEKLNDECEHGV